MEKKYKNEWMTTVKSKGRVYVLLSLVLLSQVAIAHNKVVVVPLFGEEAKSIANVITVAKSG